MGDQLLLITHNLMKPHLLPLPDHKTNEVSFIREGDERGWVGNRTSPLTGERVLPGASAVGQSGVRGVELRQKSNAFLGKRQSLGVFSKRSGTDWTAKAGLLNLHCLLLDRL